MYAAYVSRRFFTGALTYKEVSDNSFRKGYKSIKALDQCGSAKGAALLFTLFSLTPQSFVRGGVTHLQQVVVNVSVELLERFSFHALTPLLYLVRSNCVAWPTKGLGYGSL